MSETLKERLRREMQTVRRETMRLLAHVPQGDLNKRIHDFYSPVGWHFGHVGRIEEYWTCQRAMGRDPIDKDLDFLFTDRPDNPKDRRVDLPDRAGIVAWLRQSRAAALECLDAADLKSEDPLLKGGFAWEFAIQHEYQHQETIKEMTTLLHRSKHSVEPVEYVDGSPLHLEFISLKGGEFPMGSEDPYSYDNEKPIHPVEVGPYQLAARSVSVAEWEHFMMEGGYTRDEFWSAAGRSWRDAENVVAPFYWSGRGTYIPDGFVERRCDEPVWGISWYEAEAYAKFMGARLPTEREWEYAACRSCMAGRSSTYHPHDATQLERIHLLNGVWEWTGTVFAPYDGFEAFPYDGYSKDHFDGRHMVCKGGSFATSYRVARPSFRNFYVPGYRQGFLGMRLAKDA